MTNPAYATLTPEQEREILKTYALMKLRELTAAVEAGAAITGLAFDFGEEPVDDPASPVIVHRLNGHRSWTFKLFRQEWIRPT